jgi:protein tyrosine phosphatase (PTP) superfamily phosphohydrolase (DUF442 family)
MLNKSITIAVQPHQPDPRRLFENAMAQLEHGKERRTPSQMPICVRPRKEHQPAPETQVVADAARALAQLWNVSPMARRQASNHAV